jgi:hypothetical protein
MKTNKTFAYGFLTVILALAFIACDNGNPSNSQPKTYTVTFNADNGSEPTTQTVTEGNTVNKPADPSKTYTPIGLYAGIPPTAFTFVEWQKSDGSAWNFTTDTVTADVTLTAQWTSPSKSPIDITNETGNNIVEKAVSYVNANGGSEYTLVLGENVSDVAPQTLDQDDTTLTITSGGNIERKISLGNINGSLFAVGGTSASPRNVKLVINGHVTLIGREDNNNSLVSVIYGGNLNLEGNTKLIENKSSSPGGGIVVSGGSGTGESATVTMSENAEISGNAGVPSAGGVYVMTNGSFIMNNNAVIKNNTANDTSGGGVRILGGNFIMNGGEIYHNTAPNSGGGVAIGNGGTFAVLSDEVLAGIHDNTAPTNSQVIVNAGGTFTVGGEPADSF